MKCKKCKELHTPGAMYNNGICAYCYHKTDTWNMNGDDFTRKEDTKTAEMLEQYFKGMEHGKWLSILWVKNFIQNIAKESEIYSALKNNFHKESEKDLKFMISWINKNKVKK